MSGLSALLARQPKGRALLQDFYRNPDIFRRDIERIHMRHWLCAGHESRIPDKGDYFLFEFAEESIIVVRGRDGVVRAFANVCRHRGSRVCWESEGNQRVFVCPYHGWAYELDGGLRSARHSEGRVETARYGLHPVHVQVLEGLIFVCCADDPPDFADVEVVAGVALRHYGWARARSAHRAVYAVDANWKLVTENYQECYHCALAHPEFSRFHSTTKPVEETLELREAAHQRARAMGIEIPEIDRWPGSPRSRTEGVACFHDATFEGSVSGTEDGGPAAPLMGDFSDYDGGFTYFEIGPASFFLAYPDHGVMYLFLPREVERSEMEVVWLVDADAREGRDYELSRLIWMWDVTSIADKKIIEHNQKGVNSRFYEPGPYLPMEITTRSFVEWYLEEIREESP